MVFLKNHPKALPYLFLTEMWERFGFYVVQGLLVLYMSTHYGFSDDTSYTIMGVFSALAYIAPFVGGFLADRVLGARVAIVWGAIFLSIGYALLAIPWTDSFYVALSTIIVGNGLLKPNISSLLGSLYDDNDPRRDSGFTIFYIGINLGVLLSGFCSGYIKDNWGWSAAFALASIGLIIGLLTFAAGMKYLISSHNPVFVKKPRQKPWLRWAVIAGALVTIVLLSLLLQNDFLAKWLLPCAGIFLLIYLMFITLKQAQPYRNRMLTLNALIISSIIFWMIYLQLFFSVNMFIERIVNRNVFGFHIPTTAFYALEAIFIIILGPLFAWSWQTLAQARRNPSTFIKFVLAIVCLGLAFLVLALSTHFSNSHSLVNPLWVVFSYLLITIGELFLSPIGLSAVTTLSPKHLVGMMMGIWFVALGFGGQFAGWLAKLSNVDAKVASMTDQMFIYRAAFLDYALIAFCVALFLFVIHLVIKRILFEHN